MIRLHALERYAAPAPKARQSREESCELCGVTVGPRHDHVVDLQRRAMCCACRACALLFTKPGAAEGRYRTVPDRVRVDPGFALEETQWSALQVPVRLAFFFFNSAQQRWVALYPSPLGATEAEVPTEPWAALGERTRLVSEALPDVEAVLVRGRRAGEGFACFLVPISDCYELVGTLRRLWKGFDGGDEARQAIDAFFTRVRQRARTLEVTP